MSLLSGKIEMEDLKEKIEYEGKEKTPNKWGYYLIPNNA